MEEKGGTREKKKENPVLRRKKLWPSARGGKSSRRGIETCLSAVPGRQKDYNNQEPCPSMQKRMETVLLTLKKLNKGFFLMKRFPNNYR